MEKLVARVQVANHDDNKSFILRETHSEPDAMPEFAGDLAPSDFYEFHRNKFVKPAYLKVLHSPSFQDSHMALQRALRNVLSHPLVAEDMLMCETTGQVPSKPVRMQLGKAGILAMMQGPGDHLKYGTCGLLDEIVKPQYFDFFHALMVFKERARFFCPRWEHGLDACMNGAPVIISHGSDSMKAFILPEIFKGETTCTLAFQKADAPDFDGPFQLR